MFVFDTDTLSELLKRSPSTKLLNKLGSVPREQQFTTAITVGEMVYGALKRATPEYLIDQFQTRLWPNLRILPFDHPAAEPYADIRVSLERAGTPLAEPDLRIAAIALSRGFAVITGNIRHLAACLVCQSKTGCRGLAC